MNHFSQFVVAYACVKIFDYLSISYEIIHVEINPYLNQLKDLAERSQTLRGYL